MIANRLRWAAACRAVVIAAAVIAGAFAALAAPPAYATEVRSRVEPDTVEVGGRVVFVIEVHSGLRTRVRFPPRLELSGLQRVAGANISDGVYSGSLGTGRRSRVAWQLIATEEGTARIGPVTIEVAGEPVEVPGASVQVLPLANGRILPDPRRWGRRGPDGGLRRRDPVRSTQPPMFLQAEAHPRQPWVGQQVVYTLWAYTTNAFTQPDLEAPTRFPGFWAEDVDLGDPSALFERVWLDGRVYHRVPLLRRLLFPLAAGEQTIEPLVISVERGRSLIDPLVIGSRRRRVSLTSNSLEVTARALPSDAPAGFTGLVGRVELEARLSPPRLTLGEHATLEIEVEGEGNLQGLPAPAVEALGDLTLLPPESDGAKRVSGVQLFGRRIWRYAVIPEAPGTTRVLIPGLAYFDADAGGYRHTAEHEIALTVLPRPAALAEVDPAPGEPETERSPLAAFAAALGSPAALLAAGGGLAAVAALLVFGLRRRRARRGPGGAWRQQLERARETDRPRRAAAAIEAAWRELLSAQWQIAPDLPPTRWAESLRQAGAAPQAAAELGKLARDLQLLRRAPELASIGALTDDLIARSHRLSRALG